MAEANRTNDTVRAIVLTSFAITSLISLVVACTCCYIWAVGREVPTPLGVFLTAVITYTFTTAPTMVKEYLTKNTD